MNYSASIYGTAQDDDYYYYPRPDHKIAEAIHSHFHLSSANDSDCNNITNLIRDYLLELAHNISAQNMLDSNEAKHISNMESQKSALLYIVVVLSFYAFGIGLMMIKYMRQEAKEQEECKKYRRYINAAHEQYLNSTNRARLANRLALQALNTVNAIPQASHFGSKVTFV